VTFGPRRPDLPDTERVAPEFVKDLRARVSVSEVVGRRVKLRKAGKWWKGFSPFNKERTPSFCVNDTKRLWRDYSSGKGGDIFTFVMETEGATFREAVERVASIVGVRLPDHEIESTAASYKPRTCAAFAAGPRELDEGDRARQRMALGVWDTAIDLGGTLALSYLKRPRADGGRAVDVPEGVSGRVLRFHPRCPWRNDADELIRVPALIALCRDILTDEPRAISRRALTADGHKIGKPKSLGPVSGSAVKLSASEDISHGLHVGEGVETMLSAMMLGFSPAWALGGPGVRTFPVLDGIDALTIVVDHDRNGAGQAAASECFDRWTTAGGEVWCVVPEIEGDMNDLVAGGVR
jgi:hypothetical protein